jgi:hypothetical protein
MYVRKTDGDFGLPCLGNLSTLAHLRASIVLAKVVDPIIEEIIPSDYCNTMCPVV